MKTVNIYKAQPFTRSGEVESVTINIHNSLPEKVYADLNEWRQVAMKEAQALTDALIHALPQGVTDALLVCLLEHKRTLFVVPVEEEQAGGYHIDKSGVARHAKDCTCQSCTRRGL